MHTSTFIDEIAALAHRCWCLEMMEGGWHLGGILDRKAKVHPALRPFNELPEFDKQNLREHVLDERLEAEMARIAADMIYEPELSLRDMRAGLEMRHVDVDHIVGRVLAWRIADQSTGRLAAISVEWPDGNIDEYKPAERLVYPADWPND